MGKAVADRGEIALRLEVMTELGETDVALVETSLCDFNSLVGGRYYLGHDIDAMLDLGLAGIRSLVGVQKEVLASAKVKPPEITPVL